MDEFEKLKILLIHWVEHNDEHAEVYRNWSRKALVLGNEEVSKIFEILYQETGRLNRLVEKAIEKLNEHKV
ncbi:MAG: hypothetical protein HXY47_08115 [Nitrospirae bacterium]|nr:hypothetical protein [Nitrospirota bacterium]